MLLQQASTLLLSFPPLLLHQLAASLWLVALATLGVEAGAQQAATVFFFKEYPGGGGGGPGKPTLYLGEEMNAAEEAAFKAVVVGGGDGGNDPSNNFLSQDSSSNYLVGFHHQGYDPQQPGGDVGEVVVDAYIKFSLAENYFKIHHFCIVGEKSGEGKDGEVLSTDAKAVETAEKLMELLLVVDNPHRNASTTEELKGVMYHHYSTIRGVARSEEGGGGGWETIGLATPLVTIMHGALERLVKSGRARVTHMEVHENGWLTTDLQRRRSSKKN